MKASHRLRRLAVTLYGGGVLAAAILMAFMLAANGRLLLTQFGIVTLADTFAPMLLLMVAVYLTQRPSDRVVWGLVPVVIAAAVLLFLTLLSHAFPERALRFAEFHLAVAIPVATALLFRQRRRPLTIGWSDRER